MIGKIEIENNGLLVSANGFSVDKNIAMIHMDWKNEDGDIKMDWMVSNGPVFIFRKGGDTVAVVNFKCGGHIRVIVEYKKNYWFDGLLLDPVALYDDVERLSAIMRGKHPELVWEGSEL